MIGRSKKLKAFCLALLVAAVPMYAQQNPMRQGLRAFDEGQYESALAYFEQAETEGMRTPALQYNIAVSLYRLGRYDEARERFQALASQPAWTVLVNYNLGLVAEAQGDEATAIRYYQQSFEQQEHGEIRMLANRKLQQLVPRESRREAKPWSGLVTMSAGHDSNASSLADDLLDNAASSDDEFYEGLAYGQWYVGGRPRDGLRLYGMLFDRRFRQFDHLDTQVLGLGLVEERTFGEWRTEGGLRFTTTRLDSREVADQIQLTLSASRTFGIGTLGAAYGYSRIDAGDDFAQTEGDQHRFDLNWSKRIDALTLQTRYRHEDNDREDLVRGEAFASYSPVRDSLLLAARWQFSSMLSAGASAEYVDSDYDGTNRLRDTNGQIVTASRRNRQERYILDTSYRINANWRVRAEYQRNEVEDTFDLYTFDKNRVMATVEFEF